MRIPKSFFLKWIRASHPDSGRVKGWLVDAGVLCHLDPSGKILALVASECSEINKDYFDRLDRRVRELKEGESLRLYIPHRMRYQVESKIQKKSLHDRLTVQVADSIHIKPGLNQFEIRDKIRLVCVDDSPVIHKLLAKVFADIPEIDLVGQISDSETAVSEILRLDPDLITMDIQMPKLTGVDVIRHLFKKKFYPTLMLSSLSPEEGSPVFAALDEGAFDYIAKPRMEEIDSFKTGLLNRLKEALGYTHELGRMSQLRPKSSTKRKVGVGAGLKTEAPAGLWLLGSSTGGTQALTRIFTSIAGDIPGTLVVQHIPPVFSKAFADSLNNLCPFDVREAQDGDEVLPNRVLIAPGGWQMGIEKSGSALKVRLYDHEPVNRFKPSVDYLFQSAAKSLSMSGVVAGILTGMGKDGAEGLLALRQKGAWTIAQNEASCAVFGMPKAAIALDAACEVVDLDSFGVALQKGSRSERDRKVS